MSHKTDYFGRPMVKRLPPVKCSDCGRVVAAARTRRGKCLGCAKRPVATWSSWQPSSFPLSAAARRRGSLNV